MHGQQVGNVLWGVGCLYPFPGAREAERLVDGVELVDDLLEPELVRLVDHDEEHLVVHLCTFN